MITNPPYGERLEEKEALPALYTALGQQFAKLDSWSAYVITSYTDIEKYFGRKADKNRKIYNGMLKRTFTHFRPRSRRKECIMQCACGMEIKMTKIILASNNKGKLKK